MSQLLASSAVLVAFLGGVVALLAPCCVSVMLPAYFASGMRSRTRILTMTLVFAGGVATVILPIALGASLLSRLLLGYHTPVFAVGGALMVVGGVAMGLGWMFKLPMPGSAPKPGSGLGSVWALGAFSGAASACCAPVLAGVVALASVTASFAAAAVIGVTYVFGMVAPLAVLALVWDRRDWGKSRFFRANSISVPLGRLRRSTSLANLLAGGLLTIMGLLTFVLAFRGPGMSNDGWQIELTGALQHYVAVVRNGLDWLPGWASGLIVLALLAAFVYFGTRQRPGATAFAAGEDPDGAADGTADITPGASSTPAPSLEPSPTQKKVDA